MFLPLIVLLCLRFLTCIYVKQNNNYFWCAFVIFVLSKMARIENLCQIAGHGQTYYRSVEIELMKQIFKPKKCKNNLLYY